MKTKPPRSRFQNLAVLRVSAFLLLLAFARPASAGQTWDGGGAGGNWTTGTNWNPDGTATAGSTSDLFFAGSVGLSSTNDYAGFVAWRNILFDSGAGAFTITSIAGANWDLYGKIENNSTSLQTINIDAISLKTTSNEFDPTAGNLTISAKDIYTNGNNLNVWGANTLTINNTGGAGIQQGGLLVTGTNFSGSVILNGSNSYSGSTSIQAGTVTGNNSSSFGTGTIFIGNGGLAFGNVNGTVGIGTSGLTITNTITTNKADNGGAAGTGTRSISATYASGTSTLQTGTTSINGGLLVNVTNSAATLAMNGSIIDGSDTGVVLRTLTKGGAGTLTLSGSNSFSGGLTLSGGGLNINSNTALGTGGFSISSTGTIDNTSGGLVTIANTITSGQNTTFGGSNALTTTGVYTYDNQNRVVQTNGSGAFTVASLANTGGTNALRKRGTGTLAITGSSSSSASIEFDTNAGTVLIGNKSSLGTANLVVISGGSGTLQSSIDLIGTNKLANGVTLTAVAALTLGGSNNFEIGGVIGSTTTGSTLTKSGSNSVILSGSNTYTGATSVTSGTLRAGSTQAFGVNSAVTLTNATGVVLDLNGFNNTIGSLSGGGASGGTVTLGSGNLTITNGGTYSGTLTGSGTITFQGGTYNGNAASSAYTGNVLVTSGTVKTGAVNNVFGPNSSGTQSITVSPGASLVIGAGNNAWTQPQQIVISGTGSGTGALQSTGMGFGDNNLSGGVAVAADSLVFVQANGASDLRGLNISGPLAGTGNITLKAGSISSYLKLSGSSTGVQGYGAFTGNIFVRAATSASGTTGLILNNANAVGGAASSTTVDLADGTYLTLTTSAGIAALTDTTSTLRTGTVNLGANTLTIGNSTSNLSGTFGGVIAGTGGIAKSGSGTQMLSGTNTYTGATSVTSGTLRAGSTQAFGVGSAVTLTNTTGVFLDLNGFNNTIGSLSGGGTTGGTVALGSGTMTITAATSNQTYSGFFTGSGNIVINSGSSGGIVNFGGPAASTAFTGNVSVLSGILTLGQTHSILGTNSSGTGSQMVTISNGATVKLAYGDGAYTQNQNFVINGTGGDTFGALQSSGVDFGNAQIGGLVVATDALYTVSRNSNNNTANFVNVAGGLAGIGNLTLSGSLSGATKFGYITLSNSARAIGSFAAFTGNVNLRNGITVNSNNATALGTGNLDLADGTALVLGATQTIGGLTDTTSTLHTGTVSLGANTLTVGNSTTNLSGTFSGVISGTNSGNGITKAGSGTLTLSGSNSYSGATTVGGNGKLTISGSGSISPTTGAALNVGANNSAGTLQYDSSATSKFGAMTIGNGSNNSGTLNQTAGTINGTTLSLAATLGNGTGTVALTGGSMTLSGAAQIGKRNSSATPVASTLTLSNSANFSAASLSLATDSGYNAAGTVNQGGTSTVNLGTGALSLAGAHSTGTNTHTGIYNLNGGTLTAGSISMTAASGSNTSTGTFNFNGGTLTAGTSSAAFMQGLTTANVLSGGAKINTNNFNITIAQSLLSGTANDGGLAKSGSGTLTLSSANSYTGGTTLSSGTLNFGNVNALGSGTLTFTGGSTLQSGTSGTVANAVVINPSVTGTFDTAALSSTFSGIVSGSGALTKIGAGTLTLSSSNSYSGATIVQGGGTLTISGSGSISPTSGATLSVGAGGNSGTFQYDSSATSKFGAVNIGNGTGSPGTLNQTNGTINASSLTLNSGYSGTGPGTMNLSGGTMTVSGAATVSNNTSADNILSTLTVSGASSILNANGELRLTGAPASTRFADGKFIQNGGTVNVAGANGLVLVQGILGNTATRRGQYDLNGGTLNVNTITSTSTSGSDAVAIFNFNGGTLKPTASSTTFWASNAQTTANVLAGGAKIDTNGFDITIAQSLLNGTANDGGLTKSGSGTLTLTASNSYTGGTTLNSGTLVLGNDYALGTTGTLNMNGGDLASSAGGLSVANPLVVTGTIGGISGVNDLTFTGGAGGSGTLVVKANATAKIAGADGSFAPAAIQVNTGGTLLLAGANKIGSATAINLNGGTFNTGANSDSVGALTLSGSSTIDFSSPTATSTLVFSSVTYTTGLLTINNWDGTFSSGNTTHLRFTSDPSLVTGFLSQVQFGTPGSPYSQGANSINLGGGGYELAPIPEPATIIGALAFVGLLFVRERRRFAELAKRFRPQTCRAEVSAKKF